MPLNFPPAYSHTRESLDIEVLQISVPSCFVTIYAPHALLCFHAYQAPEVSSPNISSTDPHVLICGLASHFVVLAHLLELSHLLVKFAPKCSKKTFSPIPISSSLPGGPIRSLQPCHSPAGSDMKLLCLGSKFTLLYPDL
uniref:Uncharacterized protein n=1 Tax=Rousettus aegyptiacus TaxID=9407 RepID=A0A7J8ILX8_ROUAE|nr:hypothetical protein HJG63_010567 [Rousettus aegyptiacus]